MLLWPNKIGKQQGDDIQRGVCSPHFDSKKKERTEIEMFILHFSSALQGGWLVIQNPYLITVGEF